ncbi:MAG: ABC transporter transmembrane domain-containing protein, partial [Pyrinomonadaceae bacterium]
MHEILKFLPVIKPYKRPLIVGVFCILASVFIGLLVPLIIGNAVDDLTNVITWGKLTNYALLILASSIVSGIFLFLQRKLIISISRNIEYDMRRDFYHHLQDQPLDFFQSNRTGDLMARATNDLSAVRQLIGPAILYLIQTFFVVIFVLPLMLRISVKLTLLVFISMPFVTLSVRYLGRQGHVR